MRLNPSLFVFLLTLLAWPALADTSVEEPVRTLKAAYVEFAPYIYTGDDGQATGSVKQLSDRVARKAGYRLEWQALPIKRVKLYLQRGKVDLWLGIAGQPHLQPLIMETRVPLAKVTLSAYHRPYQSPVETIGDLRGQSLILISGYSYLGLLEGVLADPGTQHDSAPNHEAGLKMLTMGRGDYLLNYDEPMKRALEKMPTIPLRRNPLFSREATFLISRQAREPEVLVERLEKAYWALMEEEGNGPVTPDTLY
ncbi:MAG: transporter substrate-binding domain-containing protein [Oleiphilaceae bacterium]|nr:transporter substrate-binding domain-containing protein [Oleiphilaceae bacterium]